MAETFLPDPISVRHRAQRHDPVEISTGDIETSRRRAGREQKPVEGDPLVAEMDLASIGVDPLHGSPRPQLDVVLGVVVGRVDVEVLLGLAAQVRLRQLGPLVRPL